MIRAMAIDPGVTTGICIAQIIDERSQIWTVEPELAHLELYNYIDDFQPHFLITESFEYRPKERTNVVLYSRELIGVMHLYAQREHDTPVKLTLQTAAEGKGNF